MARVDRERDPLWHDGRAVRLDLHPTDSGDGRASHAQRRVDDAERDLGRTGHRIAPQVHRPALPAWSARPVNSTT